LWLFWCVFVVGCVGLVGGGCVGLFFFFFFNIYRRVLGYLNKISACVMEVCICF